MSIMVLGATGLLGQRVVKTMAAMGYKIVCTFRNPKHKIKLQIRNVILEHLNAENKVQLTNLLMAYKPTHVVNCLSMNDINSRSFSELLAIYHEFPLNIALLGNKIGAMLINISTDVVFDGKRGFYNEHSMVNPLNDYGKAKLAGELKLENVVNIRCSMFGIDEISNRGLFNWFLNADKPTIFSGYIFSGISTNLLAKCIAEIIKSKANFPNVIHVSSDQIDKSRLLMILNEEAKLKKEYTIKIRENCNYSLDSTLFSSKVKLQLPSIQDQIKELVAETSKI